MSSTQNPATPVKKDMHFDFWQFDNPEMVKGIPRFMSERVSRGASPEMVRYVGLARYAHLLESARASLTGYFSEADICLLLNANHQPWWNESLWSPSYGNAIQEMYWNLVEDDNDKDDVFALYEKLCGLDIARLLSLTDVLECAWRSPEGPLAYAKRTLEID